jgi:hypothetical protein
MWEFSQFVDGRFSYSTSMFESNRITIINGVDVGQE